MARIAFAAAMIVALCACATPPPRVVVQRVDVAVPIARPVPQDLLECTAGVRPPMFTASGPLIVLPADQIPVFQSWAQLLVGCDAAWRAWAITIDAESILSTSEDEALQRPESSVLPASHQ